MARREEEFIDDDTKKKYEQYTKEKWEETLKQRKDKELVQITLLVPAPLWDAIAGFKSVYKSTNVSVCNQLLMAGVAHKSEELEKNGLGNMFELMTRYGKKRSKKREEEFAKMLLQDKLDIADAFFRI